MKEVLANLLQKLGGNDGAYKRIPLETLKETISKDLTEYSKTKSATPAEKGLIIKFLNKVNKMDNKDALIIYVSDTMFNLSGMNA